ncbi:efflux transporter, RND family, MFP subunit [Ancylobacter novellus DSM 506]|uniref:Efflux transporter, RND family, MFP subunit n=1 Tax=Ancylobacter novellus (strain ATCC 8093 / DSM 506 / JCM 20403 / CCM 1077 / IAM 12100 / NBRC 12443 / NCIMB 10456) TaxID=639283 RepID=D7A7R8_ANCN5|nr:efflux RND transporter periplasmic adaptor subunit [Ancylobacter novellus]ADH88516.1 efflux transporter, RND family, MFP subunit [Ancylobacter novellus DSM 506]
MTTELDEGKSSDPGPSSRQQPGGSDPAIARGVGEPFYRGRERRGPVGAFLQSLWRRKSWFGAAALLLAAAAWLLPRWLVGPEVVVYPVLKGELVRTVVATGHVETPYRVEIGSQITGTVKDVLVEEGQTVRQGEALVVLDTTELDAAVVQAVGAVAQAEAQMRQMQELTRPAADEALKQARANLDNAKSAFERADRLAKSGAGTQATLDEAMRAVNVAQALTRTAELQVYTSSPGGSDYVMAQTQLDQARANLATARARLGYATITAPRDGVLITRNVERGAVVQPGTSLLVLAPAGDIQLVVQIDEKNLSLLKVGEDALASADAYPEERFAATLTYINPSVDIARASVEVKLTVPDPPDYLRQDMTVSVDIAVDRRQDAVIVPTRTVHEPTSAAPWVLVVREGRARNQPVRLGLRAADKVQILEGVAPGESLVPVAAGVRAGQRVRPVQP